MWAKTITIKDEEKKKSELGKKRKKKRDWVLIWCGVVVLI